MLADTLQGLAIILSSKHNTTPLERALKVPPSRPKP